MRHSMCAALLLLTTARIWGQTQKARPPEPSTTPVAPDLPKQTPSIPLTVVAGTPLKVSLDQEVRIQKVGQPIHGKTTEPIYAFDKLLIPAGSGVIGKVAEIDPVSKRVRTLEALNANFSPDHRVRIAFDELVLADGRHLPIHAVVAPGSTTVLQFVPANEKSKQGTVAAGKQAAKGKLSQARQDIKQRIEQVKPGAGSR